jgi:hypothetical protein
LRHVGTDDEKNRKKTGQTGSFKDFEILVFWLMVRIFNVVIRFRICLSIYVRNAQRRHIHNLTITSVADPDPGSGIRCLFDPWIRDPGWVKK